MGVATRETRRRLYDEDGQEIPEWVETETGSTPQDSVELGVNAKGDPTWTVKAYGRDPTDVATRIRALRELAETHAHKIREKKEASA